VFRWHVGKILRCWIVEKKRWVAFINLKVERARRRASLADRFLRGVTQFLDVLALRAVSFRKIHEPDEPSRQYPLWVMTPGPQHRNAERGREEAPFHRSFHWLRSNTALLAFFFRLASASRSFKRENGLTNDGDESSSPSPLSLPLSSSFTAFCLHIVKHICLVLGCRAVVNPALDSSPSRAYNIYYKSLSRSFCHPSDSSPISLSYKLALLFSLLSSESNPGQDSDR